MGKEAMKVRLQILETVIMPSVTYGMETWTNLSKKDKEEIEKIHKELITSLFELAKSTPYWGIIAETAIWPILQTIDYQKFMLLHNMLNSEDTKVSKKVLLSQARNQYPNCWYSEILQAADQYQLDIP